jgi:hypothetical protein
MTDEYRRAGWPWAHRGVSYGLTGLARRMAIPANVATGRLGAQMVSVRRQPSRSSVQARLHSSEKGRSSPIPPHGSQRPHLHRLSQPRPVHRLHARERSCGPQPVGHDRLAIVGEHFDGRAIDDDAEADAAIDRAHGPGVPAWIMRERCSTRAPAVHEDLER